MIFWATSLHQAQFTAPSSLMSEASGFIRAKPVFIKQILSLDLSGKDQTFREKLK
jgi:hypothetical protein